MVKEGEGCNVGVKIPGVAKVANPPVFHNSLDEDLDTTLSSPISLLVLDLGGPGSFGMNSVDATSFRIDHWVVARRTYGRAHKRTAVVMEVPVCIGNKSPEVVDTIDAVLGRLEKDGHAGIGETDKIVIGGLSISGEEERLGCCEG
jgi:hypothetical protein